MGLHSLTAEIDWNGTPQGTVKVRWDRFDGERCQYSYTIREADGTLLAEGDDLRSGSGAEPDLADMLGTLLSFMNAAAESYKYKGLDGDNSDLFPEPCLIWCDLLSDELEMARVELIGRERAGYGD